MHAIQCMQMCGYVHSHENNRTGNCAQEVLCRILPSLEESSGSIFPSVLFRRDGLAIHGLSVRSNHTRSAQLQWILGTCTAAVALDLGQDLGLRQVWDYVTGMAGTGLL